MGTVAEWGTRTFKAEADEICNMGAAFRKTIGELNRIQDHFQVRVANDGSE